MKVVEAMTLGAHLIKASNTIKEAAMMMAEEGIGFLPVEENNRLVGMITDRDIVTRCIARGGACEVTVRDTMTRDVKYCFDDEELDHVITNMGDLQVRRLPVLNRDKRLVGIVTIADAVRWYSPEAASDALSGIVEEGGLHRSWDGSRETGECARVRACPPQNPIAWSRSVLSNSAMIGSSR